MILLLLLGIVDALAEPAVDRCACLELQHFHDSCGREVFTQLVAWELNEYGDEQVFSWRMDKGDKRPVFDWATGEWVATFEDMGTLGFPVRQWRSTSFRECWDQHDVEMHDRERWPADRRRPVWGVK